MFSSFIRHEAAGWREEEGEKVLHLTYNLHGKGSVCRLYAKGGRGDEAGARANTISSSEKRTMHAARYRREKKLRRFASQRKKEGKGLEHRERGVIL